MPGRGFKQGQAIRNRSREKRGGTPLPDDGLVYKGGECLVSLRMHYLYYLQVRNYSEGHIDTTRKEIGYFLLWSQERDLNYPEQITRPILESYQRHVSRYRKADGKPLSIRSQRERIGSLKGYFKWLKREGYIHENPTLEIEYPRGVKALPTLPLSLEEINKVLNQPDLNDPLGVRDRSILELFYSTGIRRSELVRLRLENVDFSRSLLVVRKGKGNKDRLVPFGETALKWLLRYHDEVRPLLLFRTQEETLYLSSYGEGINVDYLSRVVRNYIKKSGLNRSGSCHLLRHTCASLMLEHGADIRYIQEMLGHSSLKSTQIYTQVNISKLQEVHRKTHPGK